jgi:PKD repeat protein
MKSNFFLHTLTLISFLICFGCKKENPQPVLKSDFTASSTSALTGDTISFANHSQNAFFYQWNFGDGTFSTLENPNHVYTLSGGYYVSMRAVGSYTSDTSSLYILIKPRDGQLITEGAGIAEIRLGDKWSKVQTDFPPTDTIYYSKYMSKYNFYSNMIYYPQKGIYVGFLSLTGIVQNEDSVYELILVSPYQGITTRGIIIGSPLTDITSIYGQPESVYNTVNSTGFLYRSLGINFYSNNSIYPDLLAEIDIYYPYSVSGMIWGNDIPTLINRDN